MREWLVIRDSMHNAVFATDEQRAVVWYIPRDAAESLLGRDLGGNQWFTVEEGLRMRAHPEWSAINPGSSEDK